MKNKLSENRWKMTDKFKKMIEEDILKCADMSNIREGADLYYGEETILKFYLYLISCYKRYINDIDENLLSPVGTSDDDFVNCIANMAIVKRKLELFLEEESVKEQAGLAPINISTTVNNENTNVVDINVAFKDAKKRIEDMTSLTVQEMDEITKKIEELEEIVRSKEKKIKKWEKANGIIKWIADKSFDVGIALLPLLLQI